MTYISLTAQLYYYTHRFDLNRLLWFWTILNNHSYHYPARRHLSEVSEAGV